MLILKENFLILDKEESNRWMIGETIPFTQH